MKSFSNALVLGLGISGVSAARLLIARGGAVVAIDKGNDDVLKARAGELRSLGVTVHLGVEAPSPDIRADLCVVSPGIAADSPWVVSVAARGAEVISELELGARHCACPMVAVTGSKGKSTAVKLLTELLQKGGRKAETAGNYGIPLCDVAMRSKSLDWAVVEVSSFQLECVREFHPRIGVILNIQPDHLDRHRTLENYRATKARIFARMEAADLGIVYDVDADAVKRASAGGNRWMTFGRSALADVRYESGRVVGAGAATNVSGSLFDNPILGRTAAAVAAIAYAMGIDRATIERAIREYEPLPHRMRDVITIDGVRYVNDSKATSLTAMCAGLEMSGGPVRLIAGGCLKEHDLEFTKQPLAKHVRAAYLIGQASPELEAAWKYVVPCRICGDLATAVAAAHQDATPGEVVLLSPACTSFDQFMNFEDRGEQFVKIVESIKKDERK
jgi:UDP-N-acetylmuramoylalanine--D-glutamate ligase